jgi:hypothetical protein
LNPEIGEISLYLDLNSKTGEKSPGRGVHAANDTPDGRAAARFPGALTLCPRVAADNRGHSLCGCLNRDAREIRLIWSAACQARSRLDATPNLMICTRLLVRRKSGSAE